MPNFDADLLSRIPLSARTVLQVGRIDGALAAAYRGLNPKARLLGLNAHPETPADAAFDQVATLHDETGALPFEAPDGIDCIIYDEVTAFLTDPWATIAAHAQALSPSGTVLLILCNKNHWRHADALLRGLPADPPHPLGPEGTPIRSRLEAAGLFPADALAQEAEPEEANRFCEAIRPALVALGIDPDGYRDRCMGSRVIWRACKSPIRRLIVSGNMLKPVGGVSHVRVVHPLHALASDPHISSTLTDRVSMAPPDGAPRIFVLHRPVLVGAQGTRLITGLAEAGYLIVTEFDDHPDHFQMMRVGGELSFTGVHALQTSTNPLAEELRKYNDEVTVFPNAIVTLPETRNFTDPDTLTFFFGALNREADWAPFMPVLNEVADVAGDRLRFQIVHDARFFEALETPHKAFTPTCGYDTYLRLLSEAEISFMPLSDTPFNRAKSDLKFIEAASHRAAALASHIVYPASIVDGKTGVIFHTPEELRLALLRLIALPGLARQIAERARQYVIEERMMAYQVQARIAWYRSLWERREELEQARRMRLARYAGLAA